MGKPKTPKEYEALGRVVAAIYEYGYLDRKQMLRTSFLKGVVTGLGGVIGATIVVTILVWVLSIFGSVPLVGRFVDKIDNTVQSTRQ